MNRLVILLGCVVGAVTVFAGGEVPALEEETSALEKAREKLDEAASKFAEYVVGSDGWDIADDWPFLGIVVSTDDSAGIRIGSVTPGGPAAEAGIRADDLIVRANNARLTGWHKPTSELHNIIHAVKPGDAVRLLVVRAGDSQTIDVVPQQDQWRHLGELHGGLPPVVFQPLVNMWSGRNDPLHRERIFGFKLIDIEETLGTYFGVEKGVLVLTAEDDSKFRPGDIVRRVGGRDVADADAAYLALAEADASTQIVVRRNGKSKSLTIEPIQGVRVRKSLEFTH